MVIGLLRRKVARFGAAIAAKDGIEQERGTVGAT